MLNKTIERKITIQYHLTCNEGIDIPSQHIVALEEDALNIIQNQFKDGMTSGELNTSVCFGKEEVQEETDEGLSYSGWWSINTETL